MLDSGDTSFEDPRTAPWLRSVLLPALVFVVAVALVAGLVLGGVVKGKRTYGEPRAVTTQPTVIIEP